MDILSAGHVIINKSNYYRSNYNYGKSRGQFNYHGNYNSGDIQNHWCETCDRNFRSAFLLEKHTKEHMTCSIDGCQFVAHPKVITKHIQMQHSTGLYNRIGNLNNPDAIAKWREERRKNYPTKENIEKKNAILKEKVERGEKMGLKNLGKRLHEKVADNNRKRNNQKTKCQRKSNNHKSNRFGLRPQINHDNVQCDTRKLKPFEGIQSLIQSESENDEHQEELNIPIDFEDDFDNKMTVEPQNINTSSVCGALSSLIMNYDSAEDEETTAKSNEISDNVHKQTSSALIEVHDVPDNKEKSDNSDSGPDEVKIEKVVGDTPTTERSQLLSKTTTKVKNKVRINNNNKVRINSKYKVPSTLLEKLLSKEIKHERNVTLQCIRFILKNNFFMEK